MFEVLFEAGVWEQFERLPSRIKARILRIFQRLALWPNVSGVKPLSGNLAGKFRIRTGDYRIQFRIEGNTVVIERIGHRDKFYD